MTSTPKYSPRGPLALGSAHSGSGAGGERLSPSQPRGRSRRGRFGSGSDRAAGNSRLRRSKPGMCPQPRRWAGCLQPRPSGAAGSPPPSPPPPPPGGFRTRMLGTPRPPGFPRRLSTGSTGGSLLVSHLPPPGETRSPRWGGEAVPGGDTGCGSAVPFNSFPAPPEGNPEPLWGAVEG